MTEWAQMSTRERADKVMASLAGGDYPDESHARALVDEVERLRPISLAARAFADAVCSDDGYQHGFLDPAVEQLAADLYRALGEVSR